MKKQRCPWAESHPLYKAYHDHEWGTPLFDDDKLFELLSLEGAQAGLNWLTILKKREEYRNAFHGFDPEKIAGMGTRDVERLLLNKGIIRNRRKIESVLKNARIFLEIKEETGSFSAYIWKFTGGKIIQNAWKTIDEIPARTTESELMSRDMKKRGFGFVGPVICYAFMQSAGLVNDHITSCHKWKEFAEFQI